MTVAAVASTSVMISDQRLSVTRNPMSPPPFFGCQRIANTLCQAQQPADAGSRERSEELRPETISFGNSRTDAATQNCYGKHSMSDSHTQDRRLTGHEIVQAPFAYIESLSGKNVRDQVITAFNSWLQVPMPSFQVIKKVVAMLHNASLLIDDVEDSTCLRRGEPSAHIVFGTAQTINSANYVYFGALKELQGLNNHKLTEIYVEELLNLHHGQGMELYWRESFICPTEDQYFDMVKDKTGGLFRLAVKLLCAESPLDTGRQRDYLALVDIIGVIFQILDDYRNITDDTYTSKKGAFEDLSEGKFWFPIIHALASGSENSILFNLLRRKASSVQAARLAVKRLEQAGSLSYTREVLQHLTKKAKELIGVTNARSGENDAVSTLICDLEHLYSPQR